MTRGLVALALCGVLATPQLALAAPAKGERDEAPAPADTDPEPVGTLSQQGEHRGVLELGLGGLLTGTAIGLAAFGTITFVRTQEHVEFCELTAMTEGGAMGIDPCVFDPPPLGFAAAGLSWALSVPLLVGAGLLFARGSVIAMDAKRYRKSQVALSPWWNRRGGGASLSLRF